MRLIFEEGQSYKKLDYVASWIMLAARYISANTRSQSAFVATNSICQGMQVPFLWPRIFDLGVEISFAYTSFPWGNSAKNQAAVHVVVVGLAVGVKSKRLFRAESGKVLEFLTSSINPYLIPGKVCIVDNVSFPLCGQGEMMYGNMPNDGGNFLMTAQEKEDFLKEEPNSSKWIRPYLGAREFLNGQQRFCLWLRDINEADLQGLPLVRARVDKVRDVRLSSKSVGANKAASTPHLFWFVSQPKDGHYILVPCHSSERRDYVPLGFLSSEVIASNANLIIPNATLYEFGILTSEMHMDWMRTVAGRLESRYRYSATLVYNTFPWPDVTEPKRKHIESLAEEILLIREDYPDKTLAQLYDPDTMPEPLLQAHKNLDRAVEALYREKSFRDASERLEHLFARYEKLIAAEKEQALAKKKKGSN